MKENKLLFFALICLFFFSCNKEDNFPDTQLSKTDVNFLDKEDITKIASLIGNTTNSTRTNNTTNNPLKIENIIPYGSPNKPAYDIVNYKNNKDFIILSADTRTEPVLAFSTSDNFLIDPEYGIPPSLTEWMNYTNSGIEEIRTTHASNLKSASDQSEINK